MSISQQEIRKRFREFYHKTGHEEVPAIPLVPKDDPTTLFTGSGMQQFVPNLLGEPHPQGTLLFNIQPCFRAQDIEEVGDNRHTTFFEMIGNWSLGDYFKEEQLSRLFHFLIDKKTGLGLDQTKLYVTVFEGSKDVSKDEESYRIWRELGIPKDRIYLYGPDKNWWSRAGVPENMPAGEPGGPDSEVFYDFGAERKIHEQSVFKNAPCHPNCDCGRFLEIGNSVFMEYKKNPDGTFSDLPKKNVDFGGGLERMAAAVNDDPDVFKTDLYTLLIQSVENITNKKYEDELYRRDIRVIADHLKAAVFIIAAGVLPSNKERGYVLRRLLRRAAVKYRHLKGVFHYLDLSTIARAVHIIYKDIYFHSEPYERSRNEHAFMTVIDQEMKRFSQTLDKGLKEINKVDTIDGKKAFDLYQSFGFPLEITEELFKQKGQTIDRKQFYEEFEKHKNLSRTASVGMFKGGLADHSEQVLKYHTATHLVHQALFDVLGDDVRQEGSNITGERLRFDFSAPHKPTVEEIKQVESIVNEKIRAALPMQFEIMPKEQANAVGAKSFFREKYPDMVKVYYIGNDLKSAYSKEFCGGPHVKNTKEIGTLSIYKTEKIGSNMYRIYAK